MNFKLLLSVTTTSLSIFGAIAPMGIARERPQCYLIDNSGQLTNLTNICNASSLERSPSATATVDKDINNDNIIDSESSDSDFLGGEIVYFLGEGNPPIDLSAFSSSYYIDNEIGNDFAAYIRRYETSPSYLPRQVIRKQAFQLEDDFELNSLTSILRRGNGSTPFLIYRYPVR